jgi:DNA-binding CsgD family transcriptional regulator
MIEEIGQRDTKLELLAHIVKFQMDGIGKSNNYIAVVVLLIAAVFFIQDIYIDYIDVLVEGKDWSNVTVEGGIFLAVLLALGFEIKRVVDLRSSVSRSQQEIMRLKGHLAEVVGNEFELWHLTKTEKEIALLLIKGLSMREIAVVRNVKEKSVRQQATGIYAKAEVSNRYELAAYFIEGLLITSTR